MPQIKQQQKKERSPNRSFFILLTSIITIEEILRS